VKISEIIYLIDFNYFYFKNNPKEALFLFFRINLFMLGAFKALQKLKPQADRFR
jgi:hypothetical protein